jgi:hypothetical protein
MLRHCSAVLHSTLSCRYYIRKAAKAIPRSCAQSSGQTSRAGIYANRTEVYTNTTNSHPVKTPRDHTTNLHPSPFTTSPPKHKPSQAKPTKPKPNQTLPKNGKKECTARAPRPRSKTTATSSPSLLAHFQTAYPTSQSALTPTPSNRQSSLSPNTPSPSSPLQKTATGVAVPPLPTATGAPAPPAT